jgi:hypothetical protein
MQGSNHQGWRSAVLRRAFLFFVLVVPLTLLWSPGSAAEKPEDSESAKKTIVDDLSPLAPEILSRAGWKAKPVLPGMKKQEPAAIILHHTGVRQNPGIAFETKLRGLQSFSQRSERVTPTYVKPVWPDLPYHYYVDHAGRIAEGRDVRYAGDTNTGYDTTNYIQVVVEGEFDHEMPKPEQLSALRKALVWLMLAWNVAPDKITTHKDHAPTTCPGQNFLAMLPEMLQTVAADRNKAISEICAGHPSAQFSSTYCAAR